MKRIDNDLVLNEISKSTLLCAGFDYFGRYNKSASLPYHNINHAFRMMQLIIELLKDGLYSSGYGINKEKLLLYAMFHDFEHSGGKLSDDVNVKFSIFHLEKFLLTQGDIVSIDTRTAFEDTVFPYSGEPKTIEGKIMRECDCLQWVFDDFLSQTIFGLKTELNVPSVEEAAEKYKKFVENELIPQISIPELKKIAEEYFPDFSRVCNLLICK